MSDTNQRIAYGKTLVELGKENKRIVVLDADLGGSTMGKLFEQAYPERHFECGMAEANMTSMEAGLAQAGMIPFTNSFAVFAGGRAYDQIRLWDWPGRGLPWPCVTGTQRGLRSCRRR